MIPYLEPLFYRRIINYSMLNYGTAAKNDFHKAMGSYAGWREVIKLSEYSGTANISVYIRHQIVTII